MKRFILLGALLLLCSGSAFAQANKNGEQRIQQGVITETTVTTLDSVTVTKQVRMSREQWRAYRDSLRMVKYGARKQRQASIPRYDAKRGFQQQVSFGWWWTESWEGPNYSALRFSYIGGRRFNDYFFAGVGAGLDIGVSNTYKPIAKESVDYWGDSCYYVEDAYGWYDHSTELPMQSIAIPLFVNLKGYFTKTKVAPYLSFSAGARLSTGKKLEIYNESGNYDGKQRYGAFKPFFEVAAGVNYRKSADRNYTFQFGYYTHNIKEFDGHSNDFDLYNEWSHGFSMSIGMTF
ncbi:MAG: hypothetical protein IJE99_01430 [Alistipes sp.]|nr:hypothetical protein [Alistipes sp.]